VTDGPTRPPIPPHTIRRSARARRARLTVTAEGAVVVVLPDAAPERAAAALLEAHRGWLDRQLGRVAAVRARIDARPPLLAGRTLVVHGIPHAVRVLPADGRLRTRIERRFGSDPDGVTGELLVTPGTDGRAIAETLERWLRREAGRIVTDRVAARAPAMGVTPGRITIRGPRTRWGSASRDGSLSFNWRLVLAPPYVLDAVVVHELAHLRWRGHGVRFWGLARRHAPRTDEARAWLRAHHAELDAALE
jgi:predicted metal-dependent hydrolase